MRDVKRLAAVQMRWETGLSQVELAKRLSRMGFPIAPQTVSDYERGHRMITREYIAALAAIGHDHNPHSPTPGNLLQATCDECPICEAKARIVGVA